MNTDKLEVKLMALVVSCRTMESQEEIRNQIMQCADDIVKNYSIPAVVRQSEQFKCEKCGSDWGEVRATCFNCNHESEDLST